MTPAPAPTPPATPTPTPLPTRVRRLRLRAPLGEISPESSRIGPAGNKYPFEVEADTGDLVVGGGSNLVLPHPEAEIGDEHRTLLYEGGHFERIELEELTLHQSDPVTDAGNAVSPISSPTSASRRASATSTTPRTAGRAARSRS